MAAPYQDVPAGLAGRVDARPTEAGRPLPRRLVALLIAMELVLFGAAGYLASRFVAETRTNRAWVEHSQQVVTAFTDLRLANARLGSTALYYINGDTGQRGSEMRLAIAEARRRIAELSALGGNDPQQLAPLRAVSRQLERRMEIYERILDEVAPGDAMAARSLVTELSRTADPLRVLTAAFTEQMRDRLAERNRDTDASLRRSLLLLIAAFATAFLFGGLATLLFLNQLRLQRARWLEVAGANAEIARQAEALRSGRRRLNAVLDNARDGIVLVSPDLEITMANEACAALLGMRQEEIVGRRLADFLPDFEVAGGAVWRNRAVRADGSSFPAEVSVGLCQLDDGPATVCVLRDVSERQRLEQVKDDFVSTVSHELRTPLTSIRGSLGLVVGRAAGELPPKAQALLEIAHKNSARLIELVNDLLDIEKIETHRIAMRREPVEVGGLVAAAVEANQDLTRQAQSRIEVVDRTTGGPRVMGDAGRLQQVLTNLLSNAVKFSPQGERIILTIENDAAAITLSVRDFGSGITEAFKPYVFQRFAQAEAGDTRRSRGTGLGLSIVKSIVEQHGGALGFESPLPDGGTRFWFSLPRLEDEAASARLVDWIEKPFDEVRLRASLVAAVDGRRHDAAVRILHVENDEDLVAVVREVIGASAKVETAASIHAARELLAQRRFDLVILDLELPDGNGLDLVPLLESTHSQAALLILSATDVPEGGFGMVQASLTKSRTDNARLAETIGRLLGQARQHA